MSLEKADAIVIRQVDFSESSRVVTFFGRETGRFSALAKGAKRLKGPFEAGLDLLSTCRVVFIRKAPGTLNLLTEARLIQRFQPAAPDAKSGLIRTYAGCYVAELLNGLSEDFDPAPDVFTLASESLNFLSSPDFPVHSVLIHFEVSLLQLIGLLPNLFECSVCGGEVLLDSKFAHWVSQGGLLCGGCRREEFAGTSISTSSLTALKDIVQQPTGRTALVPLTSQQEKECHRFAVSAITHALGRRPSTLRYIPL